MTNLQEVGQKQEAPYLIVLFLLNIYNLRNVHSVLRDMHVPNVTSVVYHSYFLKFLMKEYILVLLFMIGNY